MIQHGHSEYLKKLAQRYPTADAYLFLGDSEDYPMNIQPFISIKGNNDYFIDEIEKVISIDFAKIYMTHGHQMYLSEQNMVLRAKKHQANIFLYGHTHVPFYKKIDDIILLNPGSLAYPRSDFGTSYAIIEFNQKEIKVEIKKIDEMNFPF